MTIIKRTYKVKATGEVRRCDHWTIQYRDAAGKLKRVKGYTDKGATRQLAAKLELSLARGEQGLVDPFKVQRARPLADHVADYLANLRGGGRDPMYVYNAQRRLTILADACGWRTLPEVEPNGFMRWRDEQRRKPAKGAGRDGTAPAATTLNQYLDSARAFLNWCVSVKRIGANALASVDKVTGEKKRKRRALTDDEAIRLLGVAAPDRKLVYRVALATGLRRAELEALRWGDVRLSAITPYLQLRTEATKARRADRLALPLTLTEELRSVRPVAAGDGTSVFAWVPSIDEWRDDLAAAGIQYRDDMGRQADFHGGTRKTLCTRMHRANVPLAVAMRVMRHTDARLTMVDYADDAQLTGDALPELSMAQVDTLKTVAAGA